MPAVMFKGIAFPFAKGTTAFPAPATDEDLIKQSLVQIILTAKGERVMRPDFGSNVLSFVFGNNSELLGQMIDLEVRSAIGKFEPRVIITGIAAEQGDTDILITVSYVIVSTSSPDTIAIALPTK